MLEPATEEDALGVDTPQAEPSRPSTALLTPFRSVRRSTLEERNQSVPDTNTPVASPREAQSSGAQCEGGLASRNGLMIAFDIASTPRWRHACLQRRGSRRAGDAASGLDYLDLKSQGV